MRRDKPTSLEKNRHGVRAFTLVELLVIVGVLTVLALCLLPALARTNPDTRAFQCLNNYRQLARAWRMYADDNNDRLSGVIHGTGIRISDPHSPWAQGWLTWDSRNDNTNTVLVIDARYASLAPYFGNNSRVLQCPADQFISPIQRNLGWKRRIRSVSADLYVGGNMENIVSGPGDPTLAIITKWTELTNPKPADTWLFMDEHPDSINDPAFQAPGVDMWIDLPGNLHDGGAGIAFADGRAEIHRWEGGVLNRRVTFATFAATPVANDPDITWLRARTPRPLGAN